MLHLRKAKGGSNSHSGESFGLQVAECQKKVVAFYDIVIEKSIKLLVEVYLREAPHVDIIEN